MPQLGRFLEDARHVLAPSGHLAVITTARYERGRLVDLGPWIIRRAALDAGGDPIEISSWINETKSERARLEGELKAVPAAQRITIAEIRSMIEEVGDLVRRVDDADPDDKAELYNQLTYYPEKQYVEARVEPEPPHVRSVCVRGGT
ncbi:hypothetical protein ACFOY2_51680 [Nonomuraea purpurea]|uniref:Uncharacterized protein n=1 Tax=Nonomuraea purpurea TaxID=1849276 RepID=A0ABV8GP54_9ACTN